VANPLSPMPKTRTKTLLKRMAWLEPSEETLSAPKTMTAVRKTKLLTEVKRN
jgi:hypothetical protein